jgi:hypothetical protein
MRLADPLGCRAAEEVRIARAQAEAAGTLIEQIAHISDVEIVKAQQAWCIGIIHHQYIAEAVSLVCPDRAEVGVLRPKDETLAEQHGAAEEAHRRATPVADAT